MNSENGNALVIWYRHPASQWPDALPVGNGRLGAMVWGGARVERIGLDESTNWAGAPSLENNAPDGPALITRIRQLLLADDIPQANQLAHEAVGRKLNYGTHLPLGNLWLYMSHASEGVRDYRRALDLDTGIASVSYRVGETGYHREVFASHPDQVIVLHVTCTRPGSLSLRVGLDGAEQPFGVRVEGQDTLLLDGLAREWSHSDGETGVSSHARAQVLATGGSVCAQGSQIQVRGANEVWVLIALGTTFGGQDPAPVCHRQVAAAAAKPVSELRRVHIADHQQLFRRASLDLGPSPHPDWPTDERLAAARQGEDDPQLCALVFQFGRYMLMGSSRPDSPLPAHLTGIWNDNAACRIGWTCDYHLDINTQMNYWIAELTNLSECHLPLFRWIAERLVPSGRHTARVLYDCPGWVAHTVTNAWGYSAPGWSAGWGFWPLGGVWIATHLWDHYAFTGDVAFLAEQAYPVLKEAAQFFLSYLIEDPEQGWLLTGPSYSPENAFAYQNGHYTICLGPTTDRVLLYELFSECIQASQTLDVDADLRFQWEQARAKLPPLQIGKHGQLQEWLEDYDEPIQRHRHTSHLLALFPYAQITPRTTPELAQAARMSVQRRLNAPGGFEEGSWARNNMTLFFARLEDGEAAYDSLTTLFRVESENSLMMGTKLLPPHYAYEMDYNTGATAGIAEMLLQSHAGEIHLLPALPHAWPTGRVTGLGARGGYTVDMAWADGQLVEAHITARRGGSVPVRLGDRVVQITLQPGESVTLNGSLA